MGRVRGGGGCGEGMGSLIFFSHTLLACLPSYFHPSAHPSLPHLHRPCRLSSASPVAGRAFVTAGLSGSVGIEFELARLARSSLPQQRAAPTQGPGGGALLPSAAAPLPAPARRRMSTTVRASRAHRYIEICDTLKSVWWCCACCCLASDQRYMFQPVGP